MDKDTWTLRTTIDPEELLRQALANNRGSRRWRLFKEYEASALVVRFKNAARVQILHLDLEGDLTAIYRIRQPVPLQPRGGQLQLGDSAVYQVHYQESFLTEAPPGWAPCAILQPLGVFLPAAARPPLPALCLGRLAPGIALTELVLLAYYAVTLQTVVLDESNPQGVMNVAACEYFRNHPEFVPLTRAGLCDDWSPGPPLFDPRTL